ncbi:hypothetical protein GUITHDRAFT_160614 [Guillardia theta CCMP2712]|uniref:Ion transport domain-containing protein n=1 Tax=Guillardia theta (strain CCMP2712) TaxID=905079 RepID=L1K124_GUITC|nr:hypothetical protein GUITHDRAFT_160614 [Guillardia theta CCMP2712]EKX54272.1 hypothetical protein GUITHDRAFT_160614 [Guillardia theta CCMP2712]|eukprot:XP_005841252.1 hypothetical protein GUITHDRAFT_160614 [Guillardia theta CCMP2712]
MSKLAAFGILGEVTIHAIKLGIANQVNFRDLKLTPVDAALKILRNPDIAWRLGIPNLFENRIEQEVANARLKSEAPIDESNQFATEERDSFRSKMNRLLVRLADSKTFDNIVLIAITMSTVFLTFETPSRLIPGPVSYELLDLMNILFTIIFTVEAVAKIGANGLLLPNSVEHTAYWQSIPNRMDFIVLAFNLAELFGIGALVGTRTSKLIRISKALRPLRLMSRFEGTRAIVKALVGSVKPISYAVLFLFINCSIFAVTGMALFRDKFYSCNDGSLDGLLGEGRTQCAGQFLNEDVYSPRSWSNPPAGTHFDTFPDGVLALFRVITLKWNAIWITGQDAYEVNLQPVQNYNSFVATVFFALFIFVGSFFSLNLFVSFICDGFYASQGVDTSEEIQWASIRDMIKRHLPARERVYPDNLTARYARGVVLSYQFRYFSAGCLLVNIMCMSSSHVNPSSSFSLFLSVQNDVFFGIMCLEFVLDLLGFGPEIAFTQGSGFDFFLIVATIFVMTFESSFRSAGQVVRLLRLFRFLMTLSSHSLVASIFETVVLSTVQTANIMVVLLVSMIVFAVLFVQLFGTTKYGSRLGPQANYFTFYSAMLTLFQIIFGDEWHQLMDDCSINFPSCTPTVYDRNGNELRIGDCGTRVGSLLGYHFYMIIVHYTILNLFIGMIMNNFAYITTKDSQGVIKEAEVKTISRIWVQILDPKASGCVKLHQVYKFLSAIGSPLGFYDSGNNLHRYLCIREDLSRQLKILEENRDHGNKGFLFFLKDLESKLYQEANNQWKTVQNQAEEYRKQLESYYSGNKSFKSDLVGKDAQHEGTDSDASAENDDSPSDTENQVHVSGGNMGSKRDRGRVRVKKIKRIDSSKALDKIITDLQTKSKRELKRLEREHIQAKEKEMFALQASQFSKPTVTSYMRMISFLRWLSELFVSRQKILETHRSYEVLLYTEVLETCLVWMKKSILPSRIAHNKNDYLDSIRSTASTQLATAVIKGGIQRRRFRAIKKMTNALFTSTHFLKKNRRNLLKQTRSSSFKIRSFGLDSKRAEEILLSNHSDALVKFAKLVKYRFITESEILEIAEEGGVVVQEEDIMDVDEFMLNQILSLQEISILIPHIDLREKLDDLIEKGYENSLWKLARSMGFIAGNSARLSSLSHAQVSELLHKFEEDSSEKNNIAESQARMKQYKLQMAQYREIKGSLSDITRGNQEITRVILETRKKCDELQKERSKLMKTDRTYAADDSS